MFDRLTPSALKYAIRRLRKTPAYSLFAVVSIALGIGAGAETRRPLGLAVVGGLVVSQILTLYLTPVIYLYMNRLQDRLAPARKHVGAALAAKSPQGG